MGGKGKGRREGKDREGRGGTGRDRGGKEGGTGGMGSGEGREGRSIWAPPPRDKLWVRPWFQTGNAFPPLGLLFTYVFRIITSYCRSQWSSGSMSDCSARGPGIESRCGLS